ncbi:hypothetical protein [Bacillus testis]|uniref:hypothetical protein n=1 Tax=Bacillus testis TaxID=1622072 RepID=UPI00067F5D4B|nr:hypothetical protein [Bacillus testis]
MRDDSLDCEEKLNKLVLMLLRSIKDQRSSARIFFRDMRNLEDSQFEKIQEQRDLFRENYQTVIDEGISSGVFRKDLNGDMITFGILGMTNWTYYWFDPEGEVSEEELSTIFLDMILNGIHAQK